MKIALYSPTHWRIQDEVFEPRQHELLRLEGGLDEMPVQLSGQCADLVVVHGFPTDDRFLGEVGRLCRLFPDTAVVPHCEEPDRDFLIKLMRAGVREVLLEESPEAVREVLSRVGLDLKKAKRPDGRRGTVLGLISAKGGDGSSILAANLAMALSMAPEKKVLAIDLALPFGDLDLFLTSVPPTHTLVNFSDEIGRLDAALLNTMVHRVTSQLDMIASPKSFDDAYRVDPEHVRRLIAVSLQEYDFVVLDYGSQVGAFLTNTLDDVDELIMVTTATMPSVRHASQLMRLWDVLEFDISKVRLVLNRHSDRYNVSPVQLSKAVGLPIEMLIQTDIEMAEASLLKSSPMITLEPKNKLSRAILEWSSRWTGSTQEPENKSIWHRLKIR